MLWIVLLFAAGSMAIPAPSIMLVPPHPSSQEDPIHISCMAPRGFTGANFTLYQDGEVVELLKAPKDQLRVIFNLSGGSREVQGGPFCCQYSVLGENRQPQLSNLSEPVHVSFPVPTWILALSLSLAGVALLLFGLVTIALIIRKVKVKNLNKKRERESCWVNIATTAWSSSPSVLDMSFDNSLFTIMKMTSEEDAANLDIPSGSTETPGPRKRPTSTSSSPEPPEFSTFRAC
uniref:Chromosome 19 open reading frame 38 n=1 Tax=Ovis aries TaxID=9940 RepID=A0AC11B5H1_SHEEP